MWPRIPRRYRPTFTCTATRSQTVTRLPLFPLGLVLFPGISLPLHLFEPRYRQLLSDVQGSDGRFGIVCAIPEVPETDLPAGRVGCVAEVTAVEAFEDGRSNITVIGRERFALTRIDDQAAPYLLADVELVEDVEASSVIALSILADEVRSKFGRVVTAIHVLSDQGALPVPVLADEPSGLPWSIASMINMGLEQRQRLLEERSAMARVEQMDALLRSVLPDVELRAAMHGRSAEP